MNKITQISREAKCKIYKEALEMLHRDRDRSLGLCICINLRYILRDFLDTPVCISDICGYLPEFAAFKPDDKDHDDEWWPAYDFEPREKALLSCIEQTKPLEYGTYPEAKK